MTVMTSAQAAWVRENVWTDYMRKAYDWRGCACQRSEPSTWCTADHHTWCDSGMPRPDYETLILDRNGMFPAWLPEPFEHAAPYPSDRDEHALRPLAFVWLADRLCETKCACNCGHSAAAKPTLTSAPSGAVQEPMAEEAAAWVREHVWSAAMRKTHRDVPAYSTSCACRFGMSQWCSNGRDHDRCQPGGQLPAPEGYITNRSERVLYLPEPFENPSVSATGARTTTAAQVWLADRVCRWVCPCPCGHSRTDSAHVPESNLARPITYETVMLPGLDLLTGVSA